MQVTLWQQFSSNHSASFFLVGEFETVAEAESAATELRQMLYEIGAWWDQFMVEDRKQVEARLSAESLSTPPEQRYQAKYQLTYWAGIGESLDWTYTARVEEVVSQYDRLVVVNQSAKWGETWNSVHPLDAILQQLGAKIARSGEMVDTRVLVNITAQAPDAIVLQRVQESIQITMQNDETWLTFPQLTALSGALELENLTIHLRQLELEEQMHFNWGQSAKAQPNLWFEEQLDRILRYLQQWGCRDIRYELIEQLYAD